MIYGDRDPEDGYDAGDPPARRLDVLAAVAEVLTGPDDGRREARRVDALRVLGVLERVAGVDRARARAIRRRLERGAG